MDFPQEKMNYTLILKCESCLRERRTTPIMIAQITGLEACGCRSAYIAPRAGRRNAARERYQITVSRG